MSSRNLKNLFHRRMARFLSGNSRRIGNWQDIDGWLTPYEAMGLFYLARKVPPGGKIVEIGSWKGKSTYCLSRGLRSGVIHAIDPFDATGDAMNAGVYNREKGESPLLDQFRHNLGSRDALGSISIHRGYSSQFAGQFNLIDFLFIDGDHSQEGCRFDFETFAPHVKIGGFVAFHDFDSTRNDLGPTWVIQNLLTPDRRYCFFAQFDSLWVAKKVA